MQAEGLGGPCPRCESMDCFIKRGSGTWYTLLACPECFFAYGEHADTMIEETGGIVTGADVWKSIIRGSRFTSMREFDEFFFGDGSEERMESPFEFEGEFEKAKHLCVVSEDVIRVLLGEENHVVEQ